MRIAHLIMVHKNAAQVERLVKALAHEQFDFYIHLDAKANLEDYAGVAALPQVTFIQKRYDIPWASYNLTAAAVQGIREILASGTSYDFINLMSGQDYPIKSPDSIYSFFARHIGCTFLAFEPQSEDSEWWRHAIGRIEKYHMIQFSFKARYRVEKVLNWLLPKRKFPLPYKLYGGTYGTWWTMGTDCAAYLLKFMDEHPGLRRFSYFTWAPDEFLVSTILMNSPLKDKIINDNYRYLDWSRGGPNPKTLTVEDANELARSYKLFARKFDITQDAEILDIVDGLVANSDFRLSV
ncbi:beta-1,6-N-acetylglucosaminyltransferase [Hymenobacter humi]|uniref:Peptide O-xylosyltransferase n=1 Tax=Hymenobacter humi TaxID=1411620 RepID=A0ABW2U8D6_9BACT